MPDFLKELSPIIVLFFVVGLLITTPLLLRKYFPDRLWLGLLLSVLCCPFGHLYLRAGIIYVFLLFILGFVMGFIVPNPAIFIVIIGLSSSVIMYFRFKKNVVR